MPGWLAGFLLCRSGNSLLFYGFGSKRDLLARFARSEAQVRLLQRAPLGAPDDGCRVGQLAPRACDTRTCTPLGCSCTCSEEWRLLQFPSLAERCTCASALLHLCPAAAAASAQLTSRVHRFPGIHTQVYNALQDGALLSVDGLTPGMTAKQVRLL